MHVLPQPFRLEMYKASAASKPAARTLLCWTAYEQAAWLLTLAEQPSVCRSSSDERCHLPNAAVV